MIVLQRNGGTWETNRAEGQLAVLYRAFQPSLILIVSGLFAVVHCYVPMVTWHCE